VSPAWRRFSITRLVLAQRRCLCDELAARGHTANSVIVADDDNLDIAAGYGFATVELDNSDLGARFNVGYQYAAEQGADVFVHVGSDDWVHPDTFNILNEQHPEPFLVAQRSYLILDLHAQVAKRCYVSNMWGSIPWLISRRAMENTGFAPIEKAGLMRGIDGAIASRLTIKGVNWVFQDAPAEWCVDWKSKTNITPYLGVAHTLGVGDEQEPRTVLADWYPDWLVALAEETVA
jgi:glycosyltransferase involved in cell wall biosynthesis